MDAEAVMEAALRIKTSILPGKRIEITSPELPEEGTVEVIVVLPEQEKPPRTVLDYLDSLPLRERSAEYWAQRERELQEERDSWDR
jgi:hypothetical protein